ncbi:hypothetical protein PRUPE_3G299900 [Prunus persica]|uniref:Patatin n=1 Tax=Prunus persica TaxID=3760 RepID=M5WYC7_PRUPE|nr:hypothetical protein PRUPE_3G299900 [Prunus persica]
MEKTKSPLHGHTNGGLTTVLSIDGGGIRGIIPGVMLAFLESMLQKIDGDHVRLVDYLDWVVGMSTGGLMASMLTTPNKNNHPLYAAKDIVPFYRQHCLKIFPQPRYVYSSHIGKIIYYLKCLAGPKYNGKSLCKLLKETLGDKHLQDMLTNVAIPTTDMLADRKRSFGSTGGSSYESK